MKPYKIFLTFFSILVLIALLAYFFPKGGISVFPGVEINFPSLRDMMDREEVQYKDISRIVRQNKPIDTIAPVIRDSSEVSATRGDTVPPQPETSTTPKEKAPAQEPAYKDKERENALQYPEEGATVLEPFFRSLHQLNQNNRLIRILHYGDSQIEGDRISSYLRNQLQAQFGGAGIGLFPVVLPHNTNISMDHRVSKEWRRFTPRHLDEANFNHRRFGVLMSFSRFSPYYSYYQDEVYEASISINDSPINFERSSQFTQCRIFFSHNEKPFIVKMNYRGKTTDAEMVPPSDTLTEINWRVPASQDELQITFQGNHSPDIYGMALDGKTGIALDNIPLRGSRGTDFTENDTAFLKSMLKTLNVKLIILHFGVNLVPTLRESYDFYARAFYRQLKMLQSIDPNLSIIVMGVTDMSRKVGGDYQSYPNIEKIRDAQKEAAFRADCAFWDTYQAMGGKNSMPSWVFAEPPLARKDFTHFTYKGSVVIAKLFYKALMRDYRSYRQAHGPAEASGSTP